MADDHIQAHRRARFKALIKANPYLGNLSELGRALGYKDGVYVRQMRDAKRPITEKTVAKVEALPGKAGWFGEASQFSAVATAIAAYYDHAATEDEKKMLARMVPVDIDLTESGFTYETDFGKLQDEKNDPKKKGGKK